MEIAVNKQIQIIQKNFHLFNFEIRLVKHIQTKERNFHLNISVQGTYLTHIKL